jgi:hypothetical protein
MASRGFLRVFVSSSILILCWYGQPRAFAKDKCQTFVKYSQRSVDISFPMFKSFPVKFGAKPERIQVASDMAQLLDFYQYTKCVQLNRVNQNDPTYGDIVQEHAQATERFFTLIALLYAANSKPTPSQPDAPSAKDGSDPLDEFISQTVLTGRAALKLASSKDGKKVLDTSKQWQLDQSRIEQALKAAPARNAANAFRPWDASPIRPWESIAKQKREMIMEQLQKIVLALKGPLNNFDQDKLRTYVWMPAGDGHLQVPDEPTLATDGSHPRQDRERMKIPIGYGFTGVAYEQKMEQYGCLPRTEKVEFTMGNEDAAVMSQRRARRVLLEAEYQRQPTAQWVIAVPLKNPKDEVIAVLSISSDQNPNGFPENCRQVSWHAWETRLEKAYHENRSAIDDAVQKIEDLLTPSSSDGSQ